MSNDSGKDDGTDPGSNASGSQQGGSAVTWDSVDSGQSDDIENSLTGQGVSDRETTVEVAETETDRIITGEEQENRGQGGGGGGR